MRTIAAFIVATGVVTICTWAGYSIGWSEGSMQGHTLGVLNCETREMCDRFLPGAKAWLARKEQRGGVTQIGEAKP